MSYLQDLATHLAIHASTDSYREKTIRLALDIDAAAKSRSTVLVIANGGSSAIASHLCVDLIKNVNVRAHFMSDHGLLTCFSNDYGYEYSGEQYLQRFMDPGSVVILISSSGKSPNILRSAMYCIAQHVKCFGYAGFGQTSSLAELLGESRTLQVDSCNYNVVEAAHLAMLLDVVEFLRVRKQEAVSE